MEHWHPNPDFFFKPGGGPILDMGPYYLAALCNLLGPVESVQAKTSIGFAERVVTAEGPNKGSRIAVETPTTVMALLRFVSGADIVLSMSWDVWKHGHPPIELYGTDGSLRVPDPNFFGGSGGGHRARRGLAIAGFLGPASTANRTGDRRPGPPARRIARIIAASG